MSDLVSADRPAHKDALEGCEDTERVDPIPIPALTHPTVERRVQNYWSPKNAHAGDSPDLAARCSQMVLYERVLSPG